MRRITSHARIEVALATVFLLGSCTGNSTKSQFNDQEMDEISDISAAVAYDVVLEHEKIANLERRIKALEGR